MPSKERRERAKERKRAAEAVANAPDHIKKRLGQRSVVAEQIEALTRRYGYRGIKYAEDGQEVYSEWGKAGGTALKAKADSRCAALKKKYANKWGIRRHIDSIAKAKKISPRTVERYYARDK